MRGRSCVFSQVLHFISTCGKTTPGTPYIAKYHDVYGNRVERAVPCPRLISKFFGSSNGIDVHNQTRQGKLAIESNWDTRDCWFRVDCTIVGMTVTDAWKGLKYAKAIPESMSIRKFTNQLAKQMLVKRDKSSSDGL